MTYEELVKENEELKAIVVEATEVIDNILVSGRNESGAYYAAPYSLEMANDFQGRYVGIYED